jgi:hypothetical protein
MRALSLSPDNDNPPAASVIEIAFLAARRNAHDKMFGHHQDHGYCDHGLAGTRQGQPLTGPRVWHRVTRRLSHQPAQFGSSATETSAAISVSIVSPAYFAARKPLAVERRIVIVNRRGQVVFTPIAC